MAEFKSLTAFKVCAIVFLVFWILASWIILPSSEKLADLNAPQIMGAYAKSGWMGLNIVVTGAWIFAVTPMWRLVWRVFPVLNSWIQPDLNGQYTVETTSNWSIVDPNSETHHAIVDSGELLQIIGSLEIKMSLVSLRANYVPPDTNAASSSTSSIEISALRKNPKNGNFELTYSYAANVWRGKQTDVSEYMGCAKLHVMDKFGNIMRGIYWTNRAWTKGLNTAGIIELKRISETVLD